MPHEVADRHILSKLIVRVDGLHDSGCVLNTRKREESEHIATNAPSSGWQDWLDSWTSPWLSSSYNG